MSAEPLLEICERVLRLVGTDAEAEITVTSGTESLTRFATSFIHQNVTDASRTLHLRVALDGRVAEATANQTDDDALARLVRSTLDAARLQPSIPVGPASRHRPRRRRSTIGTTRRPRPSRVLVPSASRPSCARRMALRPPASARPRASRSRSPTPPASAPPGARRPRCSTGSPGPGAPTERREPRRRSSPISMGPLVGEEATRLARDAADAADLEPGDVRGRPLARVRRQRPRLSRHLRLQWPRRRRGPLLRPPRRSAVRPCHLARPTTSRTRWRLALASTQKGPRSGATSS